MVTQGDGGIGSGITADWVTSLKVSTFIMSTNDPEVFVADGTGDVKVRVLFKGTYSLHYKGALRVSEILSFYIFQLFAGLLQET